MIVTKHRQPPGPAWAPPPLVAVVAAGIVALVGVVAALAWASGGSSADPPIVAAPASTSTPAAPTSTSPPSPTVSTPTPVVEFLALIVDQQVQAGRDVAPGLWATTGGLGCRWSRDAGTTWQRVGFPRQAVTVSLSPGAVFETHDCAPWKRLP